MTACQAKTIRAATKSGRNSLSSGKTDGEVVLQKRRPYCIKYDCISCFISGFMATARKIAGHVNTLFGVFYEII